MLKKRLLAFDADDTLWDNQTFFDNTEAAWCGLLSDYGDTAFLHEELYRTEADNMHNLGYGSKAFTISLIETALRISGGKAGPGVLEECIALGKRLIGHPVDPLDGVVPTLEKLRASSGGVVRDTCCEVDCRSLSAIPTQEKSCGYLMVVFTKGDALEQESKLLRSGLLGYFDDYEIVTKKGEQEFIRLCEHNGCAPENLIMVGNSFKSDIEPAVRIGGRGIYIPFHVTWQFEKTEEYEHPNIHRICAFSELQDILRGFGWL